MASATHSSRLSPAGEVHHDSLVNSTSVIPTVKVSTPGASETLVSLVGLSTTPTPSASPMLTPSPSTADAVMGDSTRSQTAASDSDGSMTASSTPATTTISLSCSNTVPTSTNTYLNSESPSTSVTTPSSSSSSASTATPSNSSSTNASLAIVAAVSAAAAAAATPLATSSPQPASTSTSPIHNGAHTLSSLSPPLMTMSTSGDSLSPTTALFHYSSSSPPQVTASDNDMHMATDSDGSSPFQSPVGTFGQHGLMSDANHFEQYQNKERVVEQVLQKGKILKVSRRLRTRLEYAILKIRKGWSKYTLQEVESLVPSVGSPRIPSRAVVARRAHPHLYSHQRSHSDQDLRQTIRANLTHNSNHNLGVGQSPLHRRPPYHRHHSHGDPSDLQRQRRHHHQQQQQQNQDQDEDQDQDMATVLNNNGVGSSTSNNGNLARSLDDSSLPAKWYRQRPSLSEYKDSELFNPAKSLMDIATSTPDASLSPLIQNTNYSSFPLSFSPLYRDLGPNRNFYMSKSSSTPATPSAGMISQFSDENEDDNGVQAASAILMLSSSPSRPAARTIHHDFNADHLRTPSPTHSPLIERATPHSPMISSPLCL